MQRILSIACVFLLVLAVPAKDITALAWNCWYLANKTAIAATLCENKEKPQLQCNGKCHLAKQLKRLEGPAETTKKSIPGSMKPVEVIGVLQQLPQVPELCFIEEPTNSPNVLLQNGAPQTVSHSIFHPPRC